MTSSSPGRRDDGPAEAPLVLVVDDDDLNRKLARDVLEAAGLRTLGAATGGEAIVVAGERLPGVILLDLRLPDMDGTDVVRRLRSGAGTSRIPVVALSALTLSGGDDVLLASGFDGCLAKPIDVAAFPGQVRGYCRELRRTGG